MDSENISSLIRLSVSDCQKTDSSKVVSFIGICFHRRSSTPEYIFSSRKSKIPYTLSVNAEALEGIFRDTEILAKKLKG